MSSGLAHCLVRDGVLSEQTVRSAAGRQAIYGGALDTALLEMGVVDEATVWGTLAASTGLPVPPAALMETVDPGVGALLDPAAAWPGLAVPVARQGERLQVLCDDSVDPASLRQAAAAHGVDVELYIATEVRVRVAAQMVFGTPMPPRYLKLLARLVGSPAARRWVLSQTPTPPPLPAGPIVVTAPVAARPETPAAERLVAASETPAPPERASGRRGAGRSTEGGPRSSRSRRAAGGGRPVVADDPAATVEGMAPLQQVMELAPSMGEAAPGSGESGEATDEGRETHPPTRAWPTAVEPPPAPPPREAAGAQAAPTPADGPPDEQLLATAEESTAENRVSALRALRTHLDHPRVRALAARLRDDVANAQGERAVASVIALAELRDPAAFPVLLGRLGDKDGALAKAVHGALVEIAKQDFGASVRRWRTWWNQHQDEERIDWLFVGLSHKTPEIRYSASDELRVLTGEYFGYHFDLPRREREEARARWESWWLENRGKG
ncbi:MAG TPA: hypothetical protein VNO55_16175 [Polyangia bacterium]|nr:hypothetical protein [Polyangia bacterium]